MTTMTTPTPAHPTDEEIRKMMGILGLDVPIEVVERLLRAAYDRNRLEREMAAAKELIALLEESIERYDAAEVAYRAALKPFAMAASKAINHVHPVEPLPEHFDAARAALEGSGS